MNDVVPVTWHKKELQILVQATFCTTDTAFFEWVGFSGKGVGPPSTQ